MTLSQTSLDAYDSIQDRLGAMQIDVLNVIRNSSLALSHFQISQVLNIFPSTVSARVRELERAGLVYHDGFTINDTGKRAKAWRFNHAYRYKG